MKPIDVICLIFILIGVIVIIVSMVHRHKGMWNLRNDDLPGSPRSIKEPYEETFIGVILVLLGVLFGVYDLFGLKAAAVVAIIAATAGIVFNIIMLRRVDRDESARYSAGIMVSGFVIFVCIFLLALVK
ncbi:MAG: hypothetical protein ACI4JZ_03450 [Oscillospiraceae bacterium]